MSLLCEICADSTFNTTGKPRACAAAAAASGVGFTMVVATTGTPAAASKAFASGSVSTSRPSRRTLSMRAPMEEAMEEGAATLSAGSTVACAGARTLTACPAPKRRSGGVCISSNWLRR